MYFFLMLLIPCVLGFYCIKSKDKAVVPVCVFGAVLSIIVCICTALFSFLHRIPEYSFSSNFSYFAMREYIFPLVLLYAFYFIVSKDEISFKIKAFFPVSASFFAFYMPYLIIVSNQSVFSFYELFVKPLIFVSMLILIEKSLSLLYKFAVEKKTLGIIIVSTVLAFVLFIPPFLNTLWITNWLSGIFVIFSILYILFAVFIGFLSILKEDE